MSDTLVSLKRSKKERKEESMPVKSDAPDYPYGTQLSLDHDEMEKLGMQTPNVGDKYHVQGHAHVTSVEESDHEGGKKRRHVRLQITRASLKPRASATGRAGGKDADMQDGAKAEMDQALQNQDDNDS